MIVQLFAQVNPFSQKTHIGGRRNRGTAPHAGGQYRMRARPGNGGNCPGDGKNKKSPGTLFGARADQRKRKRHGINRAFLPGAPRGTRTPDLLVRSQSLYPAELWAHFLLRTVVLTTIAIISHLLQLVKRFFEFFSGFSKKVCITRNFGVFCLRE